MSANNTNLEIDKINFCSGYGQYHTNESDSKTPDKTLIPYETISVKSIRDMVDSPKSLDKSQSQWLIPSTLPSRKFKEQEEKGEYYLLWADLDETPKELPIVEGGVISIIADTQYEIYTTKSATEQAQKARILIVLSKSLNGKEWQLCQEILNNKLEALGITPDRASERTAQLCYLPNKGEFYKCLSNRKGELFNPLESFEEAIDQIKLDIAVAEKEGQECKAIAGARRAKLQYTGSEPDHLITSFNNAYAVEDILLKANYSQRGDVFRHPNSSSGKYTASVKNGRVHALSSDDPLFSKGKHAHDAFSAFVVLFHGGY